MASLYSLLSYANAGFSPPWTTGGESVSTISFLFVVAPLGLLLWIAGVCIYRLYFHPLSKYPGPHLAKLTTLYGAYHGYKGDWSATLFDLHHKHGDYVRWNPHFLIINTAQAFEDIYGHGSKCLKAENYRVLSQKAASILTIRDPKKHRARRHRVSQALSEENIRRLMEGMNDHIGNFCELMCTQPGAWSPVRDMSQWCNYLLFDMMMSAVFSNSLSLVTQPSYRHIPDVVHQLSRRQSMYMQSLKLALLAYFKLDWPFIRESLKARDIFVGFLRNVIKERFKKSLDTAAEPTHDIYSFLMAESKRAGAQPLSAAEFNAECANMVVAGFNTTATTLAACIFYLGRYRSAYELAANEVRSHFCNASEIRLGSSLASCNYLRACIQETLRLSPPVGSPLPRETPVGGVVIDGIFVPGGMLVGSSIYSIQHKEEHFSDPHTFRPERWLPDRGGAKDLINHDTRAYGPFQIGPRGCVGKSIALRELTLSMAQILFRLDFQTVEQTGDIITIRGPINSPMLGVSQIPIQEFITARSEGPYVRYRRRHLD